MLEMLLEIKFRRLSIFSSTLAVISGLWHRSRALVSLQPFPCSASAAEMMSENIVFLSDVGVMKTPALGALLIGVNTSSVDHRLARRIRLTLACRFGRKNKIQQLSRTNASVSVETEHRTLTMMNKSFSSCSFDLGNENNEHTSDGLLSFPSTARTKSRELG